MCDKIKLIEVFKKVKQFHVVIHLAALKGVGESVKEPLKYFHNNLSSLIKLLGCIGIAVCRKLVFSSSFTVYGIHDELPGKETAPFKKSLLAYGSNKQVGEDMN